MQQTTYLPLALALAGLLLSGPVLAHGEPIGQHSADVIKEQRRWACKKIQRVVFGLQRN